MMSGLNRLYCEDSTVANRKQRGIKCVFISHQKADASICSRIADYLKNAGIDVYFDEYDKDLKIWRQQNNPANVVYSIKKGIQQSSHMLCVISPNTLYSKWVPWEVGYGYDTTQIAALTLKGIKEEDLPDYIKTVTLIRGTRTLNDYISKLAGEYKEKMFSSNRIINESTSSHPLDNYLDWNL
jgi:hypothetical protein